MMPVGRWVASAAAAECPSVLLPGRARFLFCRRRRFGGGCGGRSGVLLPPRRRPLVLLPFPLFVPLGLAGPFQLEGGQRPPPELVRQGSRRREARYGGGGVPPRGGRRPGRVGPRHGEDRLRLVHGRRDRTDPGARRPNAPRAAAATATTATGGTGGRRRRTRGPTTGRQPRLRPFQADGEGPFDFDEGLGLF